MMKKIIAYSDNAKIIKPEVLIKFLQELKEAVLEIHPGFQEEPKIFPKEIDFTVHPKYRPTSRISKEEFSVQMELLVCSLETLNQKKPILETQLDEIVVSIMKVIAKLATAHMGCDYKEFSENNILPVHFIWLEDGLFIKHAEAEHKDLIGRQVISINRVVVTDVYEKLKELISYETENGAIHKSEALLRQVRLLKALKIADSKEQLRLEFSDGSHFDVKTVFRSALDKGGINLNSYSILGSGSILRIDINNFPYDRIKEFNEFYDEVIDFARNPNIQKIIIDLRDNEGGNPDLFKYFLEKLKAIKEGRKVGPLRVSCLIGRKTFSSAVVAANQLKKQVGALIIGAETGGFITGYGGFKEVSAKSPLRLGVCLTTCLFIFDNSEPKPVLPDIAVEQSSEDYFLNIDIVLKRAIEI
jgi:hypothetical protein